MMGESFEDRRTYFVAEKVSHSPLVSFVGEALYSSADCLQNVDSSWPVTRMERDGNTGQRIPERQSFGVCEFPWDFSSVLTTRLAKERALKCFKREHHISR
jgi:hypothetical protein